MINYIRHDEQFYGVCKLSHGDEVLGEIIVTEDPADLANFPPFPGINSTL